jgi:homoserine dehydrogenase
LLDHNKDRLAEQAGRQIRVAGLSARTKGKDRGVAIGGIPWFDDPVKLATDPSIAVFVELIGGADGVAKEAVEAALRAGKHVVTANKALLAEHGVKLAQIAEEKGVALNFEAAVAGGIPIIKTLREALAHNEIDRVYGIHNGTCNFILTAMASEQRSFDDVLKQAQELGYAEADPTFDIGGFDTAHKLAILTSLAFGVKVAPDQIHVEGIQTITEADIEAAEDMGYRIKLLGVATRSEGGIEARVNPAMVPKHSAIAEVSGVTNAVAIDADYCGSLLLIGPGAGAHPTASAVASDIVDIARGGVMPPFVTQTRNLRPYKKAKLGAHQGA